MIPEHGLGWPGPPSPRGTEETGAQPRAFFCPCRNSFSFLARLPTSHEIRSDALPFFLGYGRNMVAVLHASPGPAAFERPRLPLSRLPAEGSGPPSPAPFGRVDSKAPGGRSTLGVFHHLLEALQAANAPVSCVSAQDGPGRRTWSMESATVDRPHTFPLLGEFSSCISVRQCHNDA